MKSRNHGTSWHCGIVSLQSRQDLEAFSTGGWLRSGELPPLERGKAFSLAHQHHLQLIPDLECDIPKTVASDRTCQRSVTAWIILGNAEDAYSQGCLTMAFSILAKANSSTRQQKNKQAANYAVVHRRTFSAGNPPCGYSSSS
jgi:hypothetical protein